MMELIRLFAQIALLRRGPQDIPAAGTLLMITALFYVGVNIVVSLVMPPFEVSFLRWVLIVLADTAFVLVWYAVLLRIAKRPERFVQTATAVLGYQAVLAPLSIAAGWLVRRLQEDQTWQLPATLAALVVLSWTIAVNAHIVRHALEWSLPPSAALVILQVLIGQLLLSQLTPPLP